MRRGMALAVAVVVAALVGGAGSAWAQVGPSPPQTVAATGTGQTRVRPANRHSNASIDAAVQAARKASIAGAVRQAHEYARDYAAAVGLTLGGVISISDVQSNGFYGPGPGFIGPFGPGQYCGTIERAVGRPVKGHRRKLKKVHRCFVPQFASTTLTVTYAASGPS